MLHLNFVYSYAAFGERHKSSDRHPSTMTWEQVAAQALPCAWQSDFRAIRREWDSYCWPGGYPLYYPVKDGCVLCPRCANKELHRTLDPDDDSFFIVGCEANYEDPELYCEHCNERIPSAYVEDDRSEFITLLHEERDAEADYHRSGNLARLDNARVARARWVAEHPIFEGRT